MIYGIGAGFVPEGVQKAKVTPPMLTVIRLLLRSYPGIFQPSNEILECSTVLAKFDHASSIAGIGAVPSAGHGKLSDIDRQPDHEKLNVSRAAHLCGACPRRKVLISSYFRTGTLSASLSGCARNWVIISRLRRLLYNKTL